MHKLGGQLGFAYTAQAGCRDSLILYLPPLKDFGQKLQSLLATDEQRIAIERHARTGGQGGWWRDGIEGESGQLLPRRLKGNGAGFLSTIVLRPLRPIGPSALAPRICGR